MSGLSTKEADALRLWVQITSAINQADELGMSHPPTFSGWMVLAYLAIQPGGVASYTGIRSICNVRPNALTRVLTRLIDAKLVESFASAADPRQRELRLTKQGSSAIGQILRATLDTRI